MNDVRVDPVQRRAYVQGGSLLRNLDRAAEPHGLATTAGNVSHTGVGGLTLGGGMGWLARQFGMSCDNVVTYTVVTADCQVLRASATEHPDLYWGLRGGGGNFGVVTEFEFRLHPISHRALSVELVFDAQDAVAPLQRWRELLPVAPRPATLDSGVTTATEAHGLPSSMLGRTIATLGYVWVGDMDEARAWLPTIRTIGTPLVERVTEMRYVELQGAFDARHGHGMRRYNKGHYLTELSDGAIEAYLARGETPGSASDRSYLPNGGFQAYGGAIADVPDDDAAFSQRDALIEWGEGSSWLDPAEDDARIAASRAYAAALEPFASGVYVNALTDDGAAGVRRAYRPAKLAKLSALKSRYDPDNVFHLNQNIPPG